MTSSKGSETTLDNEFARVDTGSANYPITVLRGDITEAAEQCNVLAPAGRFLLISDSNVAALYSDALSAALGQLGRAVRTFVFPAGEASKSVPCVSSIWDKILAGDVDRGDTVIALGGGVTGDLGGFAAATVMRGINLIQMPTSMLAMSDAAIGGKTGINVGAGKNLVGSFYQPLGVICWLPSLKTLSPRELRSGMAEVVKSALIDGPEAVNQLRAIAAKALSGDVDALSQAAAIGAGLKADIVSRDVLEHGVRSYLNLGHTFGHAIEHAMGYGEWTHGEAVAAGMVLAARYSADHGHAPQAFVDEVRELVTLCELPSQPPKMSTESWFNPMTSDKKRSGDTVKLILAKGAGGVFVQPTGWNELRTWLRDNVAVDS